MAEPPWRSAVSVVPEPRWEAELLGRLGRRPEGPSVWVTDLLDPRPAYFRRRFRVPPDPARRARQAAGRDLHARLGAVLAAPEVLEVRIRRGGVVGQIDLFDRHPTELKTTESLPDPGDVPGTRPGYVDQLGMYCALTDRPEGRLLLVEAVDGAPGRCQAYRVRFRSPALLLEDVRTRAEALRRADRENSPADLPRCAWFGRGCEFRAAGVCDCTGDEPAATPRWRDELEELELDEALSRGLADRLAAAPGPGAGRTVERFRDLLYPRRAYYDRVAPATAAEGEGAGPVEEVRSSDRPDLYRELLDALESGPPGEVTRVPVPSGEPAERVAELEGAPFLLKVTRFPRPYRADELADRQPQYLLELGVRCAAVGRSDGWLLIGYERPPAGSDRLRVYRVTFAPIDPIRRIASERAAALAEALAVGTPGSLPPCPGWMRERCPHRAQCGCPDAPGTPPRA
jgi:hypothetical protein